MVMIVLKKTSKISLCFILLMALFLSNLANQNIAKANNLSGLKTTPTENKKSEKLPEINPNIRLEINIPARRLHVFENEQLLFVYPVAVGKPWFKTPVGERKMDRIIWNPWWYPPKSKWAENEKPARPGPRNPLGPVKMRLGGTILLHGTNKRKTVGTSASHGCMRMYNEDALELAWWLQQKLSDQNDPALLEKYQKNRRRTYSVSLKQKAKVDIVYQTVEIDQNQVILHPDIYKRHTSLKKALFDQMITLGFEESHLNTNFVDHLVRVTKRKSSVIDLNELKLDTNVASSN